MPGSVTLLKEEWAKVEVQDHAKIGINHQHSSYEELHSYWRSKRLAMTTLHVSSGLGATCPSLSYHIPYKLEEVNSIFIRSQIL